MENLSVRSVRLFALGALLAASLQRSTAQDVPEAKTALEKRVRELIERNWKLDLRAPDFGAGKTWLNVSRPLSLREDLAGKVVLIDFWTYCCINCMHVLPDLAYLEEKHAKEPFTVIGCHSAKFLNEAEAVNVRQAVLRYDIAHPVVVDEKFEIWNGFNVHSWPTIALVGADGRLLAELSGEGQRDVLDALVSQALAFYREKPGVLSAKPLPLRRESAAELARELSFPGKIAVDPEGQHLYISDSNHHRVVVTALDGRFVRAFGSGRRGLKDGPAAEACFSKPQGVAFAGGQLLVADTENHAIRSVDLATGAVATIAGNGKQGQDREGVFDAASVSLNSPWDVLARGQDALVAMAGSHQVWKLNLAEKKLGPFAGNGRELKADGPFEECSFAQPSGLSEKDGVVYVADSESSSVRAIDFAKGLVTTVAGGDENPRNLFEFGDEDGKGLGKRLQHPLAVLVHEGVLYVADTYNHKLKTVGAATGEVKAFAGTGKPGSADGPAASASFHEPGGLAARGGKLFVADTNNHRIRVVDLKTREVSTLRLEGVPVPMSAASAAGGSEPDTRPLPDLPGTIRRPAVEAKLAPGKAALRIRLALPAGEKLAPEAPSQFRVLSLEGGVKPGVQSGRIQGSETTVTLNVEGSGKLLVQAIYYHCSGNATCSVRSARWEISIEAAAGGKSEVVLSDGS